MKARLRRMFCKAFMKKKSRYSLPSHITLNNCIPHEKKKKKCERNNKQVIPEDTIALY